MQTFFVDNLNTIKNPAKSARLYLNLMASEIGFEPMANWLTANCSTAELPGRYFFEKFIISRDFIFVLKRKFPELQRRFRACK